MSERYLKDAILIVFIGVCSFSCVDKEVDNSLTIGAYRELGVPDPNRQWTITDYTQAHNVLAKLRWEKQYQLPVKDSEKSGLLFDRMVSLDYLAFLQDSKIPLNEKAQRISEFGVVYDYWIDVYTTPTVQKSYYNREILDVQILNLRLTEAAFNLANKINQSDDPADVALQYGYTSIKHAYLECLNNYLLPRINSVEFAENDMEKMVDSIHHSLKRNKQWLDSAAVSGLKKSLRSAKDSTTSTRILNKYKLLENQLPA
jgi:hypothetical protein